MNLKECSLTSLAWLLAATILLWSPTLLPAGAITAATCTSNPIVTSTADSGPGSLRQAIADACDASTITFASTVTGTIGLQSHLLIDKNLTIQGPGADVLAVSGNDITRIFFVGTVNPKANVTLSGLTITGGHPFTQGGGGILNGSATLTIANCTVSFNRAVDQNGGGGGIANLVGNVTVINCSIYGNSSADSTGGGIDNDEHADMGRGGTVTVINSTISNNSAHDSGGGIYSLGALTVINSTISGNNAGVNGGGIFNIGNAIANNIDQMGTANIKNTIVGLNSSTGVGPDVPDHLSQQAITSSPLETAAAV